MAGLNQEGSLVLGRLVRGDSFPGKVTSYLREQAGIARSVTGGNTVSRARQAAALDALADHVSRLTLDNQLMRVLQSAQVMHGGGRTDYKPTHSQQAFASRLGLDTPSLTAAETWEEFVSAATDDVIGWACDRDLRNREAETQLQTTRDRLAKADARAEKAEDKAKNLTGECKALKNEVQMLQGRVEFLAAAQVEPVEATA